MDTLEFFRRVWPNKGYYAVCSPLLIDVGLKSERVVFPAKLYSDLEDVLQHMQLTHGKKELFFNVHTLVEFRKKGARKQDNMRTAKCFFFDLDCGEDKDYATPAEAVRAIRKFCKDLGLPKPLLVSSGRGVHAYICMTREVTSSPEWVTAAYRLKSLADHFGLKYDPSRVTDTSSLLRIPGSLHLKDKANPRPVVVKDVGEVMDTEDLLDLIETAFAENKLSMRPSKSKPHSKLAGNLQKTWDGPPTMWQDVEAACPQIARQIFLRGDVSQPEWFFGMGVLRHCEDGEQACHDLFNGADSYEAEQTDIKLAQLAAFGPTTCAKIAEVCGPSNCDICKFKGVVTAPIVAGRMLGRQQSLGTEPPPAAAIEDEDDDGEEVAIIDGEPIKPVVEAPWPFKRVKDGIAMSVKEDGEKQLLPKIICRYDIFPVEHFSKTVGEGAQIKWCVNLPFEGQKLFTMPMATLFDTAALGVHLAQEAILISVDNLKPMRHFMTAYMQELQQFRKLRQQYDHLGWSNDETDFVMPEGVIHPDGTTSAATLTLTASSVKPYVTVKGMLEEQIRALRFYNEDKYRNHQFAIGCALGSILMPATGQHGVVVNLSGETGASKSSALFAAAGMWGNPGKYVVNGTKGGATKNMRDELMQIFSNLPFCLDELSKMEASEVQDFAFNITQVQGRSTLTSNRQIRTARSGEKALIAITSANTALQSMLAQDNSAGSAGAMRVLELVCPKVDKRFKPQADRFMRQISNHYGHIGRVFALVVARNKKKIWKRVRQVMAELDAAIEAEGGERFWTAAGACVIVALEICNRYGWLAYDAAAIREWFIHEQIPSLRGVVKEEQEVYEPANMLSSYIAQHIDQFCVVRNTVYTKGKPISTILQYAKGRMIGHLNLEKRLLSISTQDFGHWCKLKSKNSRTVMNDLFKERIVINKGHDVQLGIGTEKAFTGRSWCFTVNMGHEAMGMELLEEFNAKPAPNVVKLFPGKA